jgi:hypothetical protein
VTVDGAAERLERRYRLLLSCYPRAHRAEYGEEMLGVLLADTSGDRDGDPNGGVGLRRWPAPATVADLLVGAGRAWVRWGSGRAAGSRWAGVAAVLGLALPFAMALASLPAYRIMVLSWDNYLRGLTLDVRHGWMLEATDVAGLALLGGWAVVFVLALTRLRWPTAVVAWLCTLPQLLLGALWVLPTIPDLTGAALHLCWPAVSVVAAVALTVTALRGPGTPVRLGGPALGLVLVTIVEFVLLQPITYALVDLRPVARMAGSLGWWLVLAAAAAVPVAAVALLARRIGVPGTLRAVGVAAAIGVAFLGGSGGNVLLDMGPEPAAGVWRWVVWPLLSFALPVLAARLAERRAALRRAPDSLDDPQPDPR